MKKVKRNHSSILNIDKNPKTVKGQKQGYMTAIVYFAPHTIAKRENVCKFSTPGCRGGCFYSAGHGAYSTVQNARISRTQMFFDNRHEFMMDLVEEIEAFIKKAKKKGLKPCVRLNGTSDIDWNFEFFDEEIEDYNTIFDRFPDVQFYDYTKDLSKLIDNKYSNYHLTFSRSEEPVDLEKLTAKQRILFKDLEFNIAVVLSKEAYKEAISPENKDWVIDGEANDLRFLDPSPRIIALRAKGKAKQDKTGFVIKGREGRG